MIFATAAFGGGVPSVTCDNWSSSPHYGNCYAYFDDQFDIHMLTSMDGGVTWQEASLSGDPQGAGGIPVVWTALQVGVPLRDSASTSLSNELPTAPWPPNTSMRSRMGS